MFISSTDVTTSLALGVKMHGVPTMSSEFAINKNSANYLIDFLLRNSEVLRKLRAQSALKSYFGLVWTYSALKSSFGLSWTVKANTLSRKFSRQITVKATSTSQSRTADFAPGHTVPESNNSKNTG